MNGVLTALEQIALAQQGLLRTVRRLADARLWVPLLPLAVAEAALFVSLVLWAHPSVSWMLRTFLLQRGGTPALHYPDNLAQMPRNYANLELVLGFLIGSVVLGASARTFADLWNGRVPTPGRALGEALRRAPALLVVNLPFYLLTLPLSFGVGGMLAGAQRGPLGISVGNGIIYLGTFLLQSALLFLTQLVMLEGRGPVSALRELPRTWRRGFWTALALSGTLILLLLPFSLMRLTTGAIVGAGWPELIPWLLGLEILYTLVLELLVSGAATLAFLAAVAEEDELR
jgi:hypothetical protein